MSKCLGDSVQETGTKRKNLKKKIAEIFQIIKRYRSRDLNSSSNSKQDKFKEYHGRQGN
jgi:hypothetical protein